MFGLDDIIGETLSLINKVVPDPVERDKIKVQLEQLKVQTRQLQVDAEKAALSSVTLPKVDAAVKIMYAVNDLIVQNYRPLVSTALFIWGLLHHGQVSDLNALGAPGQAAVTAIFGSFPSWMLSRHLLKKNGNGKAGG